MVPPDCSFHSQTRFRNFSRPSSRRPRLLLLHELALDNDLRRDAGVIGARLPEHVPPAHALEARQDILQRVVERMAHMQRAGDVGRRDDHGIGLRLRVFVKRSARAKGFRLFPDFERCAVRFRRNCKFFPALVSMRLGTVSAIRIRRSSAISRNGLNVYCLTLYVKYAAPATAEAFPPR